MSYMKVLKKIVDVFALKDNYAVRGKERETDFKREGETETKDQ